MASATVIYEGQLMKKGKVNRAWKNRWVKILMTRGEIHLEYYDSKMNNNLCGTIDISHIYGIQVVHFADYNLSFINKIPEHCIINDKIKLHRTYSFLIITSHRKYIWAAFDPKNFLKWLSILCRFVHGGIIKTGWLHKKGELNKKWKRIYFSLNSYKQMKYYQDEQKTVFSGNICLNEVTAIKNGEVVHAKDENKYTFELSTEKRVWYLSAESLKERRSWHELIDKWRRRDIEFDVKKQRMVITDDEAESDDEDDVKEQQEVVENKAIDMSSSSSKDILMDMDEDVQQYQCTQCGKIYASHWIKCPGCLRRGTQVRKAKHTFV